MPGVFRASARFEDHESPRPVSRAPLSGNRTRYSLARIDRAMMVHVGFLFALHVFRRRERAMRF